MSTSNKESDIKNLKIIYKKPTCYDDNDSSSTNSSANSNQNNVIDETVSYTQSTDSDQTNNTMEQNYNSIKEYQNNQKYNNDILRNNILKEINGDYDNDNDNDNDNLNANNLLKKFMRYLNKNNISFEELNNNTFFNKTIKKYILENNIEPNNVIIFLEELKLKLNSFSNSNTNLSQNDFKNIETFENTNDVPTPGHFQNDLVNFENDTLSIKNKNIMELLTNNDINTWLFIGVILISLVFIIMMTIYKK
jgi:hypothetical protein